ncbi:MAG: DASS family sodium-coupled anion symporter [Rikenellaceae bacterium]|nr:DASS family sodium-coupled anion symporter [Rikenellaceae bacterium]
MKEQAQQQTATFDPLDMNNYKIEKLPKMKKSTFEKWMARLGGPLAIIAFILVYWVVDISFIDNLKESDFIPAEVVVEQADGTNVTMQPAPDKSLKKAVKFIEENGFEDFTRANYAMLAIFLAAIILWITEAIPNYLTALLVILGLVLTEVTSQKEAFAQLGHPVMWLNILSFVLASMLVKTRAARRLALWFVLRFGHSASGVFLSFLIINVILSAFISATTVKAAILLPIFMVVAAVYGASNGKRNNFGRNIVLQNLFQVNIGASGFLTGSGANLLAASLIGGALGITSISYTDWFVAAFPLALLLLFIGWWVGTKLIFPIPKEERIPQIEGGLAKLRLELDSMGKMNFEEVKSIIIFVGVLALWATDKLHGIDATTVAFIGAVIALLPGVGVVKWNDVDIPWHLMLFSAGAYAIGAGLDATALPKSMVDVLFNSLGVTENTPFWVLYLLLTAMMLFSALLFQSKTMRALIFIPIAIGVAQKFGYPIMSLAFPVALLIEHVYVLPFNSKPAALLYTTNHYSWSDTFRFGITMMLIGWAMIILWGETVLRWLGYTEGLFF